MRKRVQKSMKKIEKWLFVASRGVTGDPGGLQKVKLIKKTLKLLIQM